MARRTKKHAAALSALRRLDDDFHEWRYEPRPSQRDVVGVVMVSLGGLAMGVGAYALFVRDAKLTPISYAPYALAIGIVLVVAFFLFGHESGRPVRVGELGVGFEDEGRVARTRWYELEKVSLGEGALRLVGGGKPLTLTVRAHAPAVRRIVAEAQKRIPKRVEVDAVEMERVGSPDASEGERMAAEPPQVTQQHCRASKRILTFEKDVRMCRRCGALYHRAEIPRRCLECGKKLKAG